MEKYKTLAHSFAIVEAKRAIEYLFLDYTVDDAVMLRSLRYLRNEIDELIKAIEERQHST